MIRLFVCGLTLGLSTGCQTKDERATELQANIAPKAGLSSSANASKEQPKTTTTVKTPQVKKSAESKVPKKNQALQSLTGQKTKKPVKNAAKWPENIVWETWEEGRRKAAEMGKPICLVVYADWCPRCRELAPVFGGQEIAQLAQKFIMVKQDQDQKPAWLEAYVERGRYVPRVFFFGLDGQLRVDVTSGHPRFPFFYSSRNPKTLLSSMTRASKG